jgi:hypothetical protein
MSSYCAMLGSLAVILTSCGLLVAATAKFLQTDEYAKWLEGLSGDSKLKVLAKRILPGAEACAGVLLYFFFETRWALLPAVLISVSASISQYYFALKKRKCFCMGSLSGHPTVKHLFPVAALLGLIALFTKLPEAVGIPRFTSDYTNVKLSLALGTFVLIAALRLAADRGISTFSSASTNTNRGKPGSPVSPRSLSFARFDPVGRNARDEVVGFDAVSPKAEFVAFVFVSAGCPSCESLVAQLRFLAPLWRGLFGFYFCPLDSGPHQESNWITMENSMVLKAWQEHVHIDVTAGPAGIVFDLRSGRAVTPLIIGAPNLVFSAILLLNKIS